MSVCTENNVFAFFFVVTGTLNSLSQEWAEHTNATSSTGHQQNRPFHHPFFLQCGKFFGQMFCLLLYGIVFGRCGGTNVPLPPPQPRPQTAENQNRNQPARQNFILEDTTPSWNKLIFLPCALCDLAGTGMLYVGLKLTYHSSYIMLRGSVLFFTSLLSVAFLARNLQTQMWVGIGVSIIGMAVLGLRDYICHQVSSKFDAYGIAAGDLLIVMAQIMIATRIVIEQKFVTKHNIHPLLAVGLEGLFGFILNLILLIPFQYIHAGAFSKLPKQRLEDSIDAFTQIKSTWQIALAFIGCVVSVAFYYYFGIDFAKKHGTISRIVLDGFSSLLIWSVLFGLNWQIFHPLLILGYILVIVGMLLYVDVFSAIRRRFFPHTIRDTALLTNTRQEDRVPLITGSSSNLRDGREGPGGPPRPTNQIL